MIIGIIGAQGNFGSKLEKRLQEIRVPGVEIFGTRGRGDAKEIAEKSDVLILAIPQSGVDALIEGVSSFLKKDVVVISFIAHFPIEKVEEITKRNVIRAMSDPWFNFAAFIKGDIPVPHSLDFFFANLGKVSPLSLLEDSEMDLFTIHFCYLFVVLLLGRQGVLISTEDHLEYLSGVFGVPKNELLVYAPEGNPKELLALLATKGGITEMIHLLFVSNPVISPEDIMKKVTEKFI